MAGKIVLTDMVAADCTDAGGKLSMISFGADATLFFNPCGQDAPRLSGFALPHVMGFHHVP